MTEAIRTFAELEETARALPPVTVAVVGAADEDVLEGALRAAHAKVARVLLVGDRARIGALLDARGARPDDRLVLVDAADEAAIVARSVELAARGEAGVLLKGMVGTGALLRGALASAAGLRDEGALLSDVCVIPNPFRAGRPLLGVSDGGVNVAPGLEQKRVLLQNGLRVLRALGHAAPRAAVLAANEKADKAMPHTLDARALAEEAAAGAFGPCLVEGPLSLDVAVSAEAARHKGVASRVAGAPDLLLAPTVEAGNLLAKALYLVGRLPVAHVIAGARVPILINSRNDTGDDRFRSVLLAMVVAARWAGTAVTASAASAPAGATAAPAGATAAPARATAAPARATAAPAGATAAPAPIAAAAGAPPRVLAVNPGATSTKLALYAGREPLWREDAAHPSLPKGGRIADQLEARVATVRALLERHDVRPGAAAGIRAVVGRGGLLPPLAGGTYRIDDRLLDDLRRAERGEHASNLGALMAAALAADLGADAFIVDPVSVDELRDEARLTGWPALRRDSLSHALNLRAVARRVAASLGEPLERIRLVGVHLGTGISMAAFERGRMVDVVNPREEGPLSADRAGALPAIRLAKLVLGEGWTAADVERRLGREGGLQALVGTRDLREVRQRAASGDVACRTALDALVLGVAKAALGLVASLDDVPDRFFLTGGMAHDAELTSALAARLGRVAEVQVEPGEDELAALAEGALRAVTGEEPAHDYTVATGRTHA